MKGEYAITKKEHQRLRKSLHIGSIKGLPQLKTNVGLKTQVFGPSCVNRNVSYRLLIFLILPGRLVNTQPPGAAQQHQNCAGY